MTNITTITPTPTNLLITPEGNTIRLIESLADIQQHEIDLIRTAKSIAVDSETTGLNPRLCLTRLLQVAPVVQKGDQFLAVYPSTCFVFDLFKLTEEALLAGFTKSSFRSLPSNLIDFFKHLLGGENNKIGHNVLFDMSFLFYELGEDWLPPGKWIDTLILAKIFNAGINCDNSLKACLRRYAKIEVSKELQKSDWSAYNLSREQLFYAAGDVFHLGYLARFLYSKLKEERLEQIVTLELGINKLMLSPQIHGWNFDKALAEKTLKQLAEERDQARDCFLGVLDNALPAEHKLPRNLDGSFNLRPKTTGRGADKLPAGFNPGSTKQLAEKFIACGITLGQTAKGNYQVDQNELAFIRADYPVVDAYLTFRKALTAENQCEKLIEKVETWQGQDRIYFSLNQVGTDTGRLSCSGPNLQQTPRRKEFRRLFRAQPGYRLVVADYSGMELRVAAEVGNIQSMITAFANNEDLHAITASSVCGVSISEITKEQRTVGKILNFSQLYGGGVKALKRQAAAGYGVLWSDQEAEINRNKFFATFPEIKQWHEAVKNVCNDPRKKAVYTVLGRRRWLIGSAKIADDELMASPGEIGSYPLDRLTVRSNTMVQGSSADVVKLALKFIAPMLSLTATTGFKARFVAQIHDEIVLEVREDCVADWLDLLQTNMIEAGKAVCKQVVLETEAHAGDTWSEAK